jgi:hypothetical protein
VLPLHVPAPHDATAPHCPHASHVWVPPEPHCFAPGTHAGVALAHEHALHWQLAPHVCEPYVLHGCVAPAAHGPEPAHVPLVCHAPAGPHVCVSVPQLPHATGLLWPGAHMPVHAPATHVWSLQAMAAPQWPVPSQVCTPLPEHCVAPAGLHGPTHWPAMHAPLVHGEAALQAVQPSTPATQVCTLLPEHCVAPPLHASTHAASGPAGLSGAGCASSPVAESAAVAPSGPASRPPKAPAPTPPHA